MKQNKINISISLPNHKILLRQALMKNYVSKEKLLIKFIKDMTDKKILAPIGIFSLVTMIILGVFIFGKTTNPKLIQAKDMINKSALKVQTMSVKEKETAEEFFNDNLEESLKEAKLAKDLQIVEGEEFEKIKSSLIPAFNSMPSKEGDTNVKTGSVKVTSGGEVSLSENNNNKETANISVTSLTRVDVNGQSVNLKTIFKYTNPQGKKVILGINDQDIPIFKTITL